MAAFYEMDGVLFKPRAYERAAESVEASGQEAAEIYKKGGVRALQTISGVGPEIAHHIEALFKKKNFPEHTRLKKKFPVNVFELMAVEGIGPKMVKTLWQKLKIRTLADLESAAHKGKIANVARFGKKSEEKIVKGIEFLKKSAGRHVLGLVLPEIRNLEKVIQSFPEVDRALVAGSVRRRKETIGDIDILAISSKPEKVMERFVALPFVAHVYGRGQTKTNVRLKNGLDADLRVVPEKSFGAALNYFTGSKDHNIALREIAITKGWKLNEYGLFKILGSRTSLRKSDFLVGRTEEEIYRALGLRYIEPEMRENTGEIKAAKIRSKRSFGDKKAKIGTQLPTPIGYNDLKGDLQIQTNWTDGENSIEEMARSAEARGLEYIAITDHTKSLAMTGGSDEKKLLRQMAVIEKINASKKFGVKILKGAEVNIMKDGSLDIRDDVLAQLDIVGAAVHSHFKLPREEQTHRVVRAMENQNVDIIFHLTGRIINRREPIDIDIDEIIKAAKRTGTILEIDAYPDRLDIKDEYIKKCVDAGVKMSIDSDAHAADQIKMLEHGIAQARRGWATREDIINAWPVARMLKFLK